MVFSSTLKSGVELIIYILTDIKASFDIIEKI